MNIKTIEERLIEATDAKTKVQIEEAINRIASLIGNDIFYKPFEAKVTLDGVTEKIQLSKAGAIYQILKQIMEISLIEKNRKKAIGDFVNKVNTISAAYEELGIYREHQEQSGNGE